MDNTTPAPTFESIDSAALLFVSGGCHKRRCCCPVNQQTVVNMPAQPAPQVAPQVLPQAAPAPAAPEPMAAAPQGPSGDIVMTNVSVNGQPVS
jgi:hypothetical protein